MTNRQIADALDEVATLVAAEDAAAADLAQANRALFFWQCPLALGLGHLGERCLGE